MNIINKGINNEIKNTTMKNFLALIAIISLVAVTSCKKETAKESQKLKSINDLVVPAGFSWENSRDVNFEISITDARFQNALFVVSIYDADPLFGGRLLSKGSASLNTRFSTKIYLPNTIKEVYVVKTAPDNSKITQKVPVGSGAKVTASLSSIRPKSGISGGGINKVMELEDSPDCGTGCTRTITSSNSSLSINNDEVVCITGDNITVSFTGNGGTVRICGANITVQNALLNNSATLIITKTASVKFSNLNLNGTSTKFINYGTTTINDSFAPKGTFTNEGALTTKGNFNLDSQTSFVNNGILNIGETLNVNTHNVATNNGSIITGKDLELNSQSNFINNCSLWIKGDYKHNSNMKNYNLIKVNHITTVNGNTEISMYNGAILRTTDMKLDGVIKGYGSTSLVKVSGNSTLNGGSNVASTMQYCDANGIETDNGTFSGGASRACSVYIPVTNCNSEGNGSAPPKDSDDDGVMDDSDDYPEDADKAYANYYPSETPSSGASLSFEDQWPIRGDYDMNDLVMSYRYKIITNSHNKVVQVTGDYTMYATGGNFKNGFGIEFPVPRASISNLTGGSLETGQSNAVVVLFTDMHTQMQYLNTRPGDPVSPPKSYTISFNVSGGPDLSTFGLGAYNPFIWNNGIPNGRGYEVHLPGKTPTNLANTALFGTGNDNSNPSTGRYYVTATGLPWAINIPIKPFQYPVEGAEISSAYLRFLDWAQSGGTQYIDWYSNLGPGYRNTTNIYQP